jgi:hypothetical protein
VNPLVLEIDETKTGRPLPEGRGRDVVPGGAVSTRPPSAPRRHERQIDKTTPLMSEMTV